METMHRLDVGAICTCTQTMHSLDVDAIRAYTQTMETPSSLDVCGICTYIQATENNAFTWRGCHMFSTLMRTTSHVGTTLPFVTYGTHST
jgi:hypothetical protein